jgi:hypothetical protein
LLGELIPLALVVALSPVSIIPAVLLVLHTERPRPTGVAFMVGWVLALAVTTAVFVQVPHIFDGFGRQSPSWAPWVRIGIGVLSIVAAVVRWLTRHRASQSPAVLNRLGKVTPIGGALVGFGLVLANPKVLLMNAAAGLIIGTTAVGVGGWLYGAAYTVLAGSSVIIPIVAYLIAGERVDHQLERVRDWVQREHAALTAAVFLIIGVLLTYTGIRAL